jgi:cytochrome c-type biogenesis protein CcmH
MKVILVFWLMLSSTSLYAADEPLQFEDAGKQQRYQQLLEELRCLVCQNQTLADSHADLAQDLRNEVYKMVEAGQTNAGIIEFLVSRYGDFVLYRPPVKWSTVLLWFGPFAILLFALVSVYRFVQSRKVVEVVVSQADLEQLSRLLDLPTDRQQDLNK